LAKESNKVPVLVYFGMNPSGQSVTLREFTDSRAAGVATAGLDQSGTKMMRRERMRAGIRASRARLTSQ
jgi:hypothetical protein